MKKHLIIWGSVVAMLIVLYSFSRDGQSASSTYPIDNIVQTDHVRGNRTSPVMLIEYSDFQCPACAAYVPLLESVGQRYGQRVAFVYRHFPLRRLHQNSALAAQAAEAADRQGKFFEMHDVLFAKQSSWSTQENVRETFAAYAQELNLDLDRFRADLESSATETVVREQEKSGQTYGVSGTPSFFLNGKKISFRTASDLEKRLDEALTR